MYDDFLGGAWVRIVSGLLAVDIVLCAVAAVFPRKQEDVKTPVDDPAQTVVVVCGGCVTEEADSVDSGFRFYECIPLNADEQLALCKACERFDVDFALMLGLIQKETDFRNIAGDGGNSIGYCQIQPRWWADLMCEVGAMDLSVPADNFLMAAAILNQHYTSYGSWENALTAYNTGSAGESEYADCVIKYWQEWSQKLESEV